MDFVDKQYVVRIKVGQKGGEIAGAFEDGTAGLAQIYAQLFGDDVGKGGFAQSGRAEKQNVVECFAAFFGGLDENGELLFGFMLPDVVVQRFGAEGAFEQFFLCGGGLGGNDALRLRGGQVVGLQHSVPFVGYVVRTVGGVSDDIEKITVKSVLSARFAPNEIVAQGRHRRVDAVGADAGGVFVVAVDVVGVGIEADLLHYRLRQCLRLNNVEIEFFEDFVQQADFALAEFRAVF